MASIIICDDHYLFRKGIYNLLSREQNIEIISEVERGEYVKSILGQGIMPDILIMDISMPPGITGYELAQFVSNQYPQVKMIVLTAFVCQTTVDTMLKYGAKAILSKTESPENIIDAINCVLNNNFYIIDRIVEKKDIDSNVRDIECGIHKLTHREFQFAKLMCSGKAYKQIAEEMSISVNTLDNIRIRIFNKTGLKTRTEVAIFLLRSGIIC